MLQELFKFVIHLHYRPNDQEITKNEQFDDPKKKKTNRFVAPESKPFPCSRCNKRFSDKSSRYRHLKTFHNGHRYPCLECSKTFAGTSALSIHRKKQHQNPPSSPSKNKNKKEQTSRLNKKQITSKIRNV